MEEDKKDVFDPDAPMIQSADEPLEQTAEASDSEPTGEPDENKPEGKHHLIKNRPLRIVLKTLMWIVIALLLIPVLIYIPPVQTFLKNTACNVVYKSTGMKVSIDRFRLKFPLDVSLDGVLVLDAHKDTMVYARNAVADVRLMPLLRLDVKLNRLSLNDGYYRMISPDSSMILGVRAGLLEVDDQSSANIATSEIILNKALLRDGRLNLYMDVWKQKENPSDSASSTPFIIKAHDLHLENFSFGMSMLPTIDTLDIKASGIRLLDGAVDLSKNTVGWKLASVNDGNALYLTPTPEYIASHPAPPSRPSSGPPMVIKGDSIALTGFKALYAVRDAKPLPGFDASYISVEDVAIGMKDFYNESSTVRLPITRLEARERCGLHIVSGSGVIGVDSIGLDLRNLDIKTPYSSVKASADVPFALMELKPEAALSVTAKANIGLPDVDSFMPSLKEYTSKIPARNPLVIDLLADGSLADLNVERLNASLREVIELKAKGYARNPLDIKKLVAKLDFDGKLSDPALIDRFTGVSDIKVPAFTISGTAEANRETYGADFKLLSTVGDVSADGHVAINSERYDVNASVSRLDIAHFMPTLGIGCVSASVKANGAGFNPLSGSAVTYTSVDIANIEYNRKNLHDIRAEIALHTDGMLHIYAISPNTGLDFDLEGSGTIKKDDYSFDLDARLRDIDLQELGLSPDMSRGSGNIYLSGTASPERWLYDVDMKIVDFDWNLPSQYIHIPGGLTADVLATSDSTSVHVDSDLTVLDFEAEAGLKKIIDSFTSASKVVMDQIDKRNLSVDSISRELPRFELSASASGRGLLNQFLTPYGMRLDTLYANLTHDSLINGKFGALNFDSESIDIDTVTLTLGERRNLLDYRLHMGNRPGTLDEFATVNLNGYLGTNRLAASLTQHNIKGEMGYRLGLTAAVADSTVTVHFTPLRSTIAYMPWTFNSDNYVDFDFLTKHVEANLQASSSESSILLQTVPLESGAEELHAQIENLHIEDFLKLSVFAPPMTGSLNTDLHVRYIDKAFSGNGTLGINDFTYNKTRVGDFNLDLAAKYALSGNTDVTASLKIDDKPAMTAYASLLPDSTVGYRPDSLGLNLTQFPLSIANPFLDNMVVMGGRLNGDMRLQGSFKEPYLTGAIAFDSVTARVPMAGSVFRFEDNSVKVDSNIVVFDKFNIFGANTNPLTLDGSVNARSLSAISFNLGLKGNNFQAIGNDRRARSDLFGKLFLDLDATVKGPMDHFDIKANLNILGSTDLTYNLGTSPSEMANTSQEDVVKFVNFNDTTQTVQADSVTKAMNMRISAALTISPGTRATVLLSSNGTDRVELEPTASLNYFQNYMGDMRLNGNVTLGNGFARYNIPVVGEKKFTFDPTSMVTWSGDIMNPTLKISATDYIKANVTTGSNSRLVNFLVTLYANGTLSDPKVAFDLSTNDDLSIQNELQSMSADQRQTQAMNLLLYGQYMSGDTKANANLSGNMLYGFLESQLNSWAAKNIRGVDLSFGIDQYDKLTDGASSTETSYSYQVSKSLFNNRFKIQVGGNYSTDASADENLSQNLVSDISVEYILKQTETLNMAARLFRHTGYESILEGEITETGVGFVMKRKLQNLLNLFRFRRRKKTAETPASADSVTLTNKDTVPASEK